MEIKGFSNYTIDYNGNVYSKFKNRFLKNYILFKQLNKYKGHLKFRFSNKATKI